MPDRATTPEEVVEAVSNWNIGIGPDELHVALGWTAFELERYQETGDLPAAQAAAHDVEVTEQLDGPTRPDQISDEALDALGTVAQEMATLSEALRPGPLKTTPEDREADAGWMYYTRWRALPTGDGQWKVVGEHGEEDKEGPRRHDEYGPALDRADELNRAEQQALIENTNKGDI